MTVRNGPTRLILLNCGKFDYAEVDLDIPLHLVGPNNIGKTSLIALLQFLYIDEQRKMRFSSDLPTTRKYYFPDVTSFALFESLGPEGFTVTGVHGLGPVRAYEVERFAYRGKYQASDFLGEDNVILPWEGIKANLASRDFTRLKPSDLRAALTGSGLKRGNVAAEGVNLSLAPLRKRAGYRRFCAVFLNLLRLTHLRQEELKRLLLDLYEGDFTKRQINLQEEFAAQLEQLQRQRADVHDLQRNEGAIRRILDNVTERDQYRSELTALQDRIDQLFRRFKAETEARLDTYHSQLKKTDTDIAELRAYRAALSEEHTAKVQQQGKLAHIQQELARLQDEFRAYHPQLAGTQINELEHQVRSLESTLDSVAQQTPEAIERRLNDTLIQQAQRREQLAHMELALVSILVQRMGVDRTAQLSRLFNNDILRFLTEGPDAMATIHDLQALQQQFDEIAGRFTETTYQDTAVTLDLARVGHFDPDDYLDPDRLREQLTHLGREINDLQAVLAAARDHDSHLRTLHEKKDRLQELRETHTRFNLYQDRQQAHKDIDKQVRTIERDCDTLKTRIADSQAKEDDVKAQKAKLAQAHEALSQRLDTLDRQINDLPPTHASWPRRDEASPNMDLPDAITYYRRQSDAHRQLANRIDGELETIHSQTYGRYQRDTEAETLAAFRAELENLQSKQEALEQSWISFTVQLKKDFKELNRDMDRLKTNVHSLNGQLAKVHISNLSNLKIVISSHAEYQRLFNQVERTEETPLFADTGKTHEAMRKISHLLQERPLISLEDMFDMHFELTTPQGDTKTYEHLDRIESHGTTITIKVLMNLILLQGLLTDDRVNIPFYLDECSSLDSDNLRSIVQQARKLGFIAVLASPEAMDAADHLYYLSERQGRVTLNARCRVKIDHSPSDTP